MNRGPGTTDDTQVRADCTVASDGRIAFQLTALQAPAPQLLLSVRPKKGPKGSKKANPEENLLVLPVDGDGRAVLEPQPALAEGRWDMYVLPEPGAPRRRIRPGFRDLRALVDGATREWPSPVAVRVPYTTKDGFLAVRTWLRTAHAEVAGIDVTEGSIAVKARLHGADLAPGAVVRLRARGAEGIERTVESQIERDGRFTFALGFEELVAAGGPGSRVWDVSLRPQPGEGTPSIRIGRLLDDLADRKEVFVYPTVTVGGAAVRPYYTVDNDLSIEVTAVE
ncbi:transferase [Streptomyces sp. NPDC058867]|uniref:transferase n=1 Tax=unclassified Streptomyces TaxID=2593676 RepID=UPI0036A2F2DA